MGVYPWFYKLESGRIADVGDFEFDPVAPVLEILESLANRISETLEQGASPLLLGGVHTISIAGIAACARRFGKLALIQFDAHEDIAEGGSSAPHNGNWVREVVRNGWIIPEHSAQVYIRTCSQSSDENSLGLNKLWAWQSIEITVTQLADQIRELAGSLPVYISFDIDALDPSCATGTGNPAFGGPSAQQVLALLHALRGINVVGADVVEVSPDLDVRGLTALLGAQIGVNLLYLMAEARTQLSKPENIG